MARAEGCRGGFGGILEKGSLRLQPLIHITCRVMHPIGDMFNRLPNSANKSQKRHILTIGTNSGA